MPAHGVGVLPTSSIRTPRAELRKFAKAGLHQRSGFRIAEKVLQGNPQGGALDLGAWIVQPSQNLFPQSRFLG